MPYPLEILTPDGKVYDGDADSLTVHGEAGYFGVLARHAPMIAATAPGVMTLKNGDETSFFALGSGVVEVTPDKVIVLADIAVLAESKEDATAKVAELPASLTN